MAFDFPDNPIVDQEYESEGMTFVWVGDRWNQKPPDYKTQIEIALDRKVSADGDWMSGWLGLPHGDPTDPHHATPKSYVDRHPPGEAPLDNKQYGRENEQWTEILPGIGDVPGQPVDVIWGRTEGRWVEIDVKGGGGPIGNQRWLKANGDIMTGPLILYGMPSTDFMCAVPKQYVDIQTIALQEEVERRVRLDGDQMTGALMLHGNATEPMQAVTYQQLDALKFYVDSVAAAGVFVGDVPPDGPEHGQLWYNSTTGDMSIWYVDADSEQWVQVTSAGGMGGGQFLPLTGGGLTGPLHLPSASPAAPTEAVHKDYVDTSIATQSLYQGTWQVAANTPDLSAITPLNAYSWVAQTADPNVPEIADANITGIGGLTIGSGDTVKYNAALSVYEHIRVVGAGGSFLPLAGGTLTGNLLFTGDAPAISFNCITTGGLYFNDSAGALRFRIVADDQNLYFNAGGTGNALIIKRNGWLVVGLDGCGIEFAGGGMVFKRSGAGMRLRKSSGGQQWMIENNDGGGAVNIATTALTRNVEDQIGDAITPLEQRLLERIDQLEQRLAALEAR